MSSISGISFVENDDADLISVEGGAPVHLRKALTEDSETAESVGRLVSGAVQDTGRVFISEESSVRMVTRFDQQLSVYWLLHDVFCGLSFRGVLSHEDGMASLIEPNSEPLVAKLDNSLSFRRGW